MAARTVGAARKSLREFGDAGAIFTAAGLGLNGALGFFAFDTFGDGRFGRANEFKTGRRQVDAHIRRNTPKTQRQQNNAADREHITHDVPISERDVPARHNHR